MTIEIAVLISIVSVVFGVYQGLVSLGRDKSKDDKDDIEEVTTVKVILEHIREDVKETKEEVKGLNTHYIDIVTRLGNVEASAKRAHERLDAREDSGHIKRNRKRGI
ncbi:MAG: hypothetical protein R3Y53_08025 [Bacillota bacterium]